MKSESAKLTSQLFDVVVNKLAVLITSRKKKKNEQHTTMFFDPTITGIVSCLARSMTNYIPNLLPLILNSIINLGLVKERNTYLSLCLFLNIC